MKGKVGEESMRVLPYSRLFYFELLHLLLQRQSLHISLLLEQVLYFYVV